MVNFGYTKADYDVLTERERLFIMKAYENKVVGDSELLRQAVEVAMINIEQSKKKGKRRPQPLWRKLQKPLDKDVATVHLTLVKQLEKKSGDKWLELIYRANGKKFSKERRQENGK